MSIIFLILVERAADFGSEVVYADSVVTWDWYSDKATAWLPRLVLLRAEQH